MPLHVEVVSAERSVLTEDADEVLAQTVEGQIGILPHHAALLTLLAAGELVLKRGGQETSLSVGGGFLEVGDDRVVVLADSAERAEEIDVARAEEARRRAAERISARTAEIDVERARSALARAIARLRIVERTRRRGVRAPATPTGVSEAGISDQA